MDDLIVLKMNYAKLVAVFLFLIRKTYQPFFKYINNTGVDDFCRKLRKQNSQKPIN